MKPFTKHMLRIVSQPYRSFSRYKQVHEESINPKTNQNFWLKQTTDLHWFKQPDQILDSSNSPFYRWFPDGKINISYNCIDRHAKQQGDTKAIIYETAYTADSPNIPSSASYTYTETYEQVSKLAKIMKEKYNLVKGDRVIIFMPNSPEAVFSMMACARLGLIHSVVFGGFAAEELATRIKDCGAKLIISSSAGIEPKKKIPYIPIVKSALTQLNALGQIPVLLHQREGYYIENNIEKSDNISIYQEELAKLSYDWETPAVQLNSTDPLYILYTSGTTGSPKGVCRDTGGTAVALNYCMKEVLDIHSGDVFFSTSDVGWIVGHSFMVYAPLLRGATTVLYEGKPVGTPHAGKFWEIAEKYNVRGMYSSPTALRACKKEDYDGSIMKSYNLSNINGIHIAGERLDTETVKWLQRNFPENALVNDSWWQTESGWHIVSNSINLERFPVLPGSSTKPMPGYDVKIVDEETDEIITEPNKLGKVFIKLPMPPSFMLSLWGNESAFIEKYISKCGNYYEAGDAGRINEDGYVIIETRIDDIINTAGHRLSTGRIEEVLIKIDGIVEVAVVGAHDDLKGEIPLALAISDSGVDLSSEEKINKFKLYCNQCVTEHIGAISKLHAMIIVDRLPKTRSGKILRGVLKKMVNKREFKLPSTIEDASVIDELNVVLKKEGII